MEHGSLLGYIAGFAQGVAEGPVQIQEARRVSRSGHFFHEGQRDRRHPAGFDFSGKQSHGPRADRSSGDQQGQIGARLVDEPRDFFHRRYEPRGAAHHDGRAAVADEQWGAGDYIILSSWDMRSSDRDAARRRYEDWIDCRCRFWVALGVL